MANFRTHISFGAIVAMVGVVLAYYYAYVTDIRLLFALFIVTVIASFLPDLDSDSGLPFTILFGFFNLLVTGLSFYVVLAIGYESLFIRFGVPLLIGASVWFVLGGMFKKLTKHRGMFHSIPAMCIGALTTFIIVRNMLTDEHLPVLLAIGVGVGYLSHLVLDEMYSSVSINGNPFRPRRSLGSALKLLSSSNVANVFAYTLLVILLYIAF